MMIGKVIGGHYKIIDGLSPGGFGETFIAEDTHLPGNPKCVVKQLRPKYQGVLQPKNSAYFQQAQRLFNTEAEVLYKLGEHPQIPRLFAHFEENQEFYLVQELIDGNVLKKEFTGQQWNEAQVVDLLLDILTTLAFVHSNKVIHRDLKPDNLMRRKQGGKIVLIDFGAVKEIMSQITSSSQLTVGIGTPGYTPSEQFQGKPNFSSDVYAVGKIAIQALTGYHSTPLANCQANPQLIEILDQMVREDCEERYPSALEALEAVTKLINILPTVTPVLNTPPTFTPIINTPPAVTKVVSHQPRGIFNKKLIGVFVTVLIAIVTGVVVLTQSIDISPSKNETPVKEEMPYF
ncbi:serine/threonine-protein kinase [Sphaerospermopsis sp. LEGE 08334]|jgi:serine/threonine protein kinase|uniref:serine/threonine-protein kinase n=1 Tax=Sphaerospermopsis sp. LEGE 08334 TaxID=1828651 RepID=UPI00187E175B|nr:serine/threonine-protein kinase [Sphaerospermopsis sp. LEGE 08334]MBE9058777.1 serine/threonine protein kinase [Sphaerospermopsis sp. LEGE 08334]